MKSGKQIFGYGQEMFGSGLVKFQWSMDHQFIVACGQNQVLQIFDKRGNKIKEMQSLVQNAKISQMDWDKDNEFVAIMYESCNFITLWNVFGQGNQSQQMEMDNVKFKATFIRWSKTHPVLAIGTDKGSLIFFNKTSQKKIPTMGKHAKRIISGDWNDEGLLITGGEDKILTVSNHSSESKTESMSLNHEAKMVKWARMKTEDRQAGHRTITAILQNTSLLMFQFESKKQPLELFFEQKYGKVTDYQLYGDGYLVLGFSEGYISHISTHMQEVRDEVSSEQLFTTPVHALATNDILHKCAVATDHVIKMVDMSTWKQLPDEKIELPVQAGRIMSMGWTANGQVLVVTTANGGLFGFMTHVPVLLSAHSGLVAMLSSFKEVSLVNQNHLPADPALATVQLECEPSHLALASHYLATSINNIVWFYRLASQNNSQLILKKEYPSSIKHIAIQRNIVAVFSANRVTLHNIDTESTQGTVYFERRFPSQDKDKGVVHGALCENFLVIVDLANKIRYFNVADQEIALDFQSDRKMVQVYANKSGSKCVCIDAQGQGFLFLAAQEQLIPIESFPAKCNQVLWDDSDPSVFCVIDNHQVYTFVISQHALGGVQAMCVKQLLSLADVHKIGAPPLLTVLPKKVQGICLNNGTLHCFGLDGTISTQVLQSHQAIRYYQFDQDSQENHFRYFLQCLSLNKFSQCLFPAERLKNDELYETLGRKCLQNMEFKMAFQSFQKSNNLSMVMTIQEIMNETEKNVIHGHVAMILGQYDLAMDLYLKSTKPRLALDMRCDIQDWNVALNLAKTIAPQEEPFICRKLGQQVESLGNFSEAQRLYEKAILEEGSKKQDKDGKRAEHNVQCFAGIARTSIKLGDVNRGYQLANQLGESDSQHLIEIALVCENMKQLFEAAQLYQKAAMVEKAASLYIQLKMFDFATPLIGQIKSPKLLSQLAQNKEMEGNYVESERAYEKAENWENVIRLNLNQLENLEKAKQVLRNKCPTDTCAMMVALACEKKGFKQDAIEFLLLAHKKDEAFALAQASDSMSVFVENSSELLEEDRLKVAQYYEGRGIYDQAALHYEQLGNYNKSLHLYKKNGEDSLDQCVEMIGRAKNDTLTLSLLAYIMGEDDGIPKDPHYAYKVYRVLEKYSEASKIALTIWSQEMERGNYQQAHYYLFDIQRDLSQFNLQVPYEIHQKLMILHSYMIVKRVIALGHLEEAVMLLNRVCKNISQFQQHAINILTYTVIQATKAKMKGVAYAWSSTLCRQEYRAQINEKYRKNIENIARRPVPEDTYNQNAPCPFCNHPVNHFELFCERCQQNIPFCIASGKHVVKDQLCFCPSCNFPAIHEHLRPMLLEENSCPMCKSEVDIEAIQIKPDRVSSLNNQQKQELPDS